MKKIVPFKKDLMFKTNVAEITSISLEHSLSLKKENMISGSFVISGTYKITDNSVNTEPFSFDIPFDINIDDKYIADNVVIDIDDFYYEIVDNKKLDINIDLLLDKLEEKPLIEEEKVKEEVRCVEDEYPFKELEDIVPVELKDDSIEENNNEKISVSSIFDNFEDNEKFESYYIYFFRENDTVESIMQKYSINKENLSLYNNLNELKIGDKLIIPSTNNEKV